MSELYERIISEYGAGQKFLARIPGFRGYQDKAHRRTADRMIRDFVASEVQARINRLARIEASLVDNGGLAYMSKTRSAKTKMQTYHDRLKAAVPGYSGFFAAIKIDEQALSRLYSFDEAQIRYVDRFDEALNQLEEAVNSGGDIATAINNLDTLAAEANEAFDLREDVLTQLDKSL